MGKKSDGRLILVATFMAIAWCAPALAARRDAAAAVAGCSILVFLIIAAFVINILLLVWVSKDAKARGMGSMGWMILVFFTGFIGLIIYLLARTKGDKVPCPHCGNKCLAAMSTCPHCGHSNLKGKKTSLSSELWDEIRCPKCAETIKFEAKVCRYCGHEFSEKEIENEKEKRRKLIEQDEFALKKVPEYRLLQIAYDYQHNQNNLAKAKYYLERLLREFPDGEYKGVAKDRLNEIQKANPHLFQKVTGSVCKSTFPANLATTKWFISGLTGPLAGKDVELTAAPLIIGRDPKQSNLVVPPPNQIISKKHCRIRFDNEFKNILIEDLGSKNGTFLYGGERLDAGCSYILENGDRFYLVEPYYLFKLQNKMSG